MQHAAAGRRGRVFCPARISCGDHARANLAIAVTGMMEAGNYILRFDAVAGKTYAFQVSPRTDISRRVAAGFGMAGVVVEAATLGERGGPFKITQVAP
jgi:hypothetical protein